MSNLQYLRPRYRPNLNARIIRALAQAKVRGDSDSFGDDDGSGAVIVDNGIGMDHGAIYRLANGVLVELSSDGLHILD